MSHLLIEGTEKFSIFVPIIVMFLVPVGLTLGEVLHRKVTKKQDGKLSGANYRVRHNAYTFTGLIVATIFAAMIAILFPVLYLCNIQNGPTLGITIAIGCVFGFIAMLCMVMLIAFKRWGITVNEDKLIFSPCFGKRKTFSWKDINYIKQKGPAVFQVYLKNYDKKSIVFNTSIMIGGKKFLDDLNNHGVLLLGNGLL